MANQDFANHEFYLLNGYIFHPSATEEWLETAISFQPRDSDIFVTSFPKSGTHWISLIVYTLKFKKVVTEEFHSTLFTHFDIPQVDVIEKHSKTLPFPQILRFRRKLKSQIAALPAPRLFFTHFPIKYIPFNSSTKYIFIYRNLKDVVVSMYNHYSNHVITYFNGSFNEFFDFFIENNCFNYCQHLKGYFEHKDDPNLFILSYEELHFSFKTKVGEIAQFLDCELTNEVYDLIVQETDFKLMQQNPLINGEYFMKTGSKMFHKGVVGTWRDVLTTKQSKLLDEVLLSHFSEDFIQQIFIF